jgi:hypothetical protein
MLCLNVVEYSSVPPTKMIIWLTLYQSLRLCLNDIRLDSLHSLLEQFLLAAEQN